MFTDILWRFLILETFVFGAVCPFCFDEHPQKQFCISEFVVMVEFHEGKGLPGLKMKFINVFKGNIKELNFWDNRYQPKDVVNHFNFKAGKRYYLFGRNVNGIIHFKMCNGVLPLQNTTLVQRLALVKAYAIGCECIDEIGNYSSVNRCRWSFSFVYKFGNRCTWVKSGYLKRCHKRESTSSK